MYTQMQGRPAYFVAYDSLLAVGQTNRPVAAPAGGRPQE